MVEFENVTAQPLFPTHAWTMDLPAAVHGPLNRQILKDLNSLTAPRPMIRPGQNWQTEQNLHEFEEFAALVAIFQAASRRVLDSLAVQYEEIAISGCWANMNPKGAFHIPHSHPNNFLSGIYYVQAQPGANSVSFHDPRPQPEIIAPPYEQTNAYNRTFESITVQPGRLVLFPSWFVHSVSANTSDQIRISISFNIMFPDFVTTMSKPKWTGIPLRRKTKG